MKRILPGIRLVLLAMCAVSLTWLAFFKGGGSDTAGMEQPYVNLAPVLTTAERGTITNTIEATASIQANPQAPAKATKTGTISGLKVKVGERVTEGQRIAVIAVVQEPPEPSNPEDLDAAPPKPKTKYFDVVSPITGTVKDLPLIKDQSVSIGDVVANISPGAMHVTAGLNQEQRFRLNHLPPTATVSIPDGPQPFECTGLAINNDPAAPPAPDSDPYDSDGYGPSGGDSGGGSLGSLVCDVPAGVEVFPGLSAQISVTTGQASNVMTLPVTAVTGRVNTGTVWRPNPENPGEPQEVSVQLGLTDGVRIEIKSGLDPQEEVLEFAPGVDDTEETDKPYFMGG